MLYKKINRKQLFSIITFFTLFLTNNENESIFIGPSYFFSIFRNSTWQQSSTWKKVTDRMSTCTISQHACAVGTPHDGMNRRRFVSFFGKHDAVNIWKVEKLLLPLENLMLVSERLHLQLHFTWKAVVEGFANRWGKSLCESESQGPDNFFSSLCNLDTSVDPLLWMH